MHVINSQEELVNFLKKSEDYRAQKIVQFRLELEKTQVSSSEWQSKIIEWESLIPAEVMCRFGAHLEEQKRQTVFESECDEEDHRLKARHEALERAVSQAKGSGKGLLFNDSGNKFLWFPIIFSVIGMYVAIDVVKFHLEFHGEIAAWLSVLIGAALGIAFGVVIFNANFILVQNDLPQ